MAARGFRYRFVGARERKRERETEYSAGGRLHDNTWREAEHKAPFAHSHKTRSDNEREGQTDGHLEIQNDLGLVIKCVDLS